ncbi:YcjX family protein, partial [Thioclava sp. BHET1]
SFRSRPGGIWGSVTGPRVIHLDIIDYPGEWLLDLALMEKSYADWAGETLSRIASRPEAEDYLAFIATLDPAAPLEEPLAQQLAARFTGYLTDARAAGYSDCTPGRFLMPGEMAGSPVLTFAPLPMPEATRRGSLWRE